MRRKRKRERESKGEGEGEVFQKLREQEQMFQEQERVLQEQKQVLKKQQEQLKEKWITGLADRLFQSAKNLKFLGVSDHQRAVNLLRDCYDMPNIEGLVQQLSSKDVQDKAASKIWAKMCSYGKKERSRQVSDTKVFARAFNAPFRNEQCRLENLLERLEALLSEALRTGHVVAAASVLQSSGTGKSRSFVELSTLGIFVCYCSFQAKSGSPLRTPFLADVLLSKKESKKAHCRGYIRSWLQCLVGYLNGEIVLADKGDASSSTSAPPCKSKKWTVDHVILEEHQQSLILQKVTDFWQLKPDCTEDELVSTWGKVQPLLPEVQNKVKIVFVFDEASLIFSAHEEVGLNLRRVFLRSQLSAVGIFVDTCSELPLLAPSPGPDPSFRIRSGKVLVPSPIWQISNINSLISKNLDERDGLDRNQLYRYGRPLWASFMGSMMAEGKGNLQVLSEVEQFAAAKLCGGDVQNFLQIWNGKHLKSPTAIAILGARLVLDVQPHSKLAVDLVADHLSYVLHISSDRTALVTCEAWDPVITAAAATLFEADRFRHAALRKLSEAVQKSWVDEGKNGEIIARYVLMRAADIGRAKNPTVDLESFLDVLCGDIGSTEVKTSTKHQFTGDKEKEQAKEKARLARGWLNFKGFHFVVGYTPSVTNLLEFYKLEKAIICKCNQVKYDIILPVLLPSTKGKYRLEPKRMSAVLVQVKSINGKVKLHYEATTGMNPLGVIGDWKRKQPFASVLMQLGATENCHADFLSVERPATRSSGPYGMHMPFIVYGLKSMYSFLSEKEREQLSDMIHCRNPNTVDFAKSIMPLAFEH